MKSNMISQELSRKFNFLEFQLAILYINCNAYNSSIKRESNINQY